MRVVVVEDDRGFREHLQRTLSALPGVEVVYATATQTEAVQWLQAQPAGWDLAVLDIFLQQGHGFAVLRACGERQLHQRVVLLSSYTREPVRECARDAGADALFDKLHELDAFIAYVREAAERQNDREPLPA